MEKVINPFHYSVAFLIETSHLIFTANQMTGFFMKFNIAEMNLTRNFLQNR